VGASWRTSEPLEGALMRGAGRRALRERWPELYQRPLSVTESVLNRPCLGGKSKIKRRGEWGLRRGGKEPLESIFHHATLFTVEKGCISSSLGEKGCALLREEEGSGATQRVQSSFYSKKNHPQKDPIPNRNSVLPAMNREGSSRRARK